MPWDASRGYLKSDCAHLCFVKFLFRTLQGEEKAAFEAAYGERVGKAYPKNAAGQTLFPFRRLFMVAQRKR